MPWNPRFVHTETLRDLVLELTPKKDAASSVRLHLMLQDYAPPGEQETEQQVNDLENKRRKANMLYNRYFNKLLKVLRELDRREMLAYMEELEANVFR